MWLVAALLTLVSLATDPSSSKVSINLKAGWQSPPVYVEAIEYIASLGDSDALFKFIEMVSFIPELDQKSDVEIYDTVNTLVNGMKFSKADIRMMNFALSLHIFSPRIEASRTKWLEGPADCAQVFFSSGGASFCELKPEEIAEPAPVETDIVLIPGSKKIIFHGIVEAADFNDRLQAAKVFCARNNIGLSLRWQFSDDLCATPSLTGYGVELRLKSTEYKASDDSQDKSDDEDLVQKAAGFDFEILSKRFPDLQKEIKKFSRYVSDSSQEIQPMKKWQMGDLSYQAGLAAKEAFSKDGPEAGLESLQKISGNFPQMAMRLARTTVPSAFKSEVKKISESLSQSVGVRQGDSFFAINGMPVDLTSQWGDPFQLYETVKGELNVMEKLAGLGITGDLAQSVLQAPEPQGSSSEAVLKIPGDDEGLIWLNNIENDKKYAQFGQSLQEFLRPTFPGVIRRLRYNYLNLMIFVDPLSKDVHAIHDVIDTLSQNNLPVRVGVVLTGTSEKSLAASAVFHFLLKHNKEKNKSKIYTWNKWIALLTEKLDSASIKKLTGVDKDIITAEESEAYKNAFKMMNFGRAIGVGEDSSILINGAALKNLAFEDGMEEIVYQELLDAVPDIQRAIYYGTYRGETSFVEYFNSRGGVVTRFNQEILKAPVVNIDLTNIQYDGEYHGDGNICTFLVTTYSENSPVAQEALAYLKTSTSSRTAIIDCSQSSKICETLEKNAIYVNGRAYTKNTDNFTAADFALLETLAIQFGANKIAHLLKSFDNDVIMKTINVLSSQVEIKSRKTITFPVAKYSLLDFEPLRKDEASFDVVAVLDPASEDAQKMIPIISTLRKVVNMRLKIFLNCQENLSELPVKSFYRFVISDEFRESDKTRAVFTGLPHHSLLTAAVIPPESWMVAAVDAVHDLDNIKLVDQGDVHAVFELQHLLLEGQAFDVSNGSPPRGTQFELVKTGVALDTLVMANLGYFQFKASPGFWNLNLREGLSRDIYEIKEISSESGGEEQREIMMTSFTPKSLRVGVNKKSGMEDMDVLSKPDDRPQVNDEGSIWDRVGEAVGLKAKKVFAKEGLSYFNINVFRKRRRNLLQRSKQLIYFHSPRGTCTSG